MSPLQLVKLNDNQLVQPAALALLDNMVTTATAAYVGQPDITSGAIAWIHEQLQTLATMPVSAVAQK